MAAFMARQYFRRLKHLQRANRCCPLRNSKVELLNNAAIFIRLPSYLNFRGLSSKEDSGDSWDDEDRVMFKAINNVASAFPEEKSEKVKKDLHKQLKHNTEIADKKKLRMEVFEDIISDMPVQENVKEEPRRKEQISVKQKKSPRQIPFEEYIDIAFEDVMDSVQQDKRSNINYRRHEVKIQTTPLQEKSLLVQLINGNPLGIFTKKYMDSCKEQLKYPRTLWDEDTEKAKEDEEKAKIQSYFDEAIQLTKDGKMWHFPINNDQGWADEENVTFDEHVFLEHLLADFPNRGPIRHFMELVTTGLSKNPYLSVHQKHEHINWFREYFKKHQDVLVDTLGDAGKFKELINVD